MQYTPMINQYMEIKQKYQDCILFFRMGDFYEMFFDDAVVASKDMEVALTARDGGGGKKVPMCGVPYHAAESYIARLIDKGHRVAICEQVEDPKQAKGLVKREVARVITPGTVIDRQCLNEKIHNYLAAVIIEKNGCGLAYTDISTGLFMLTEFSGDSALDETMDELIRLQPAELLVTSGGMKYMRGKNEFKHIITTISDEEYDLINAMDIMNNHYGRGWVVENPNIKDYGIRAAGAVLYYLKKTQRRNLRQIETPRFYSTGHYIKIDAASRRNLEINKSIKDGARWGTLIWVLDYTVTAMGGRLLKSWLEQPLVDIILINQRLDAVEELVNFYASRHEIRGKLREIYDLERISGRIAYGNANARDLLALRKSFDSIPGLVVILSGLTSDPLKEINNAMDEMEDIRQLLHEAIVDEPPVSIKDGGLIKEGYHNEVDRLRNASRSGKDWLAKIETNERIKTGIKTLKVGYNKIFGYYIEVTKVNLAQVPEYYIRRQTLVNAERFITPEIKEYEELIIGAEDRLTQLEYDLFDEIREKLSRQIKRINNLAGRVASLDALASLAEAADKHNYVRPEVNHEKRIVINDGRHPVVELVMKAGDFVPNDTFVDDINKLILLTGPNMAGKSTYMRQVALITLMAQSGSFVPAKKAEIGIVDQIFTRIGAADDLAGGQSTFMVEMSECKNIIKYATDRSLIIMDEVGRGTSTYDGISIARALVEYIHGHIGARTLFSTHYHELTDLEAIPGICNYTITVKEKDDGIIFLRRVLPGKVDRSYGIQVARLAGLPETVLQRAKDCLLLLESTKETVLPTEQSDCGKRNVDNFDKNNLCRECPGDYILKQIEELDVLRMTPIDALNLLFMWQEKIKSG